MKSTAKCDDLTVDLIMCGKYEEGLEGQNNEQTAQPPSPSQVCVCSDNM